MYQKILGIVHVGMNVDRATAVMQEKPELFKAMSSAAVINAHVLMCVDPVTVVLHNIITTIS